MARRLILASDSPRRRALLGQLGVEFDVRPAVSEWVPPGLSPQEHAREAAAAKACSVAVVVTAGPTRANVLPPLVLAADTVVALGGERFDKPLTAARATETLKRLAGRTHDVFTGVAVVELQTGRAETLVAHAKVTFRPLSDAEIAAYVATGEPLDKAGAYGLQGAGARLVCALDGAKSTVIGLPLAPVAALLESLSIVCRHRPTALA